MVRTAPALLMLLLGATAGCGRKATVAPAPAPAPGKAFTRACPDLPGNRTADFIIRYSVHEYEHPEKLTRFVLHDAAISCPPDDFPAHLLGFYKRQLCIPLAAAAFDSLFDTLRREGIDRIRTRPEEPGPHSAGRLVELSWGGRSCSVGKVLRIVDVAPEQGEAMDRCSEAIAAVIRTSLAANAGGARVK